MYNCKTTLFDELVAHHGRVFGPGKDIRIARAPGRVNIIGEHTDYNGLPVMPTAIDREIAIAFSHSGSSQVRIVNADRAYGERSFILSDKVDPYSPGDWGNYAKAAAQALWHWASKHSPSSLPLRGFNGCATGSIPPGSGLSSSSAMVVAIACVLVHINQLPISQQELAELLARGEQYVGTEGGGMDQAASLLSKPGSLLKIDFKPLKVHPVPIPDDYAFVVANSLVKANKAGEARLAFNTRVVECRLGMQVLKSMAGDQHPEVRDARSLGDIAAIVPEWKQLLKAIADGPLTLEQISRIATTSVEQLTDTCLRMRDGSLLTPPVECFQVKKRTRHALTEGERVERSVLALEQGDASALGELMNESHQSCADDYEISIPALDELVAALRRHGAIGARLTGAGFGGCTVALVKRDQVDALLAGVWQDYYHACLSGTSISLSEAEQSDVIFVCVPSAGAGVVDI